MQNPLMQQPQVPQGQNPLVGQQPAGLPAGFDLDSAIQHNSAMGDRLSDLLGKPDLSSRDVLQALVDSANGKSISFQQAAQMATQMPPDEQLRPWLTQHLMQNIQVGKTLNMHKGGQNAR